jgi:hypothetical protein
MWIWNAYLSRSLVSLFTWKKTAIGVIMFKSPNVLFWNMQYWAKRLSHCPRSFDFSITAVKKLFWI